MKKKRRTNTGGMRLQLPCQRNAWLKQLLILLILIWAGAFVITGAYAISSAYTKARSQSYREYEVKAAFLYNFIKFVDWPKEKAPDHNGTFTIGILGKSPFGNAFETIREKRVKNRKLTIKQFGERKKIKDDNVLKDCHLLFICSPEKEHLKDIINTVRDSSVLTVGELKNFIDDGGIVNFVMEEKKIRFEINLTAAKDAKLKFRSKLLRLARRLIDKEPTKENASKNKRLSKTFAQVENY